MLGKSGIASEILPAAPRSDGGAARPTQGSLSTNTNLGIFTYELPLAVSADRQNSPAPALTLAYELRAAGNGIFGQGWSMRLPAIRRDVVRGLPKFDERDRFITESGDRLVRMADDRYRPLVERGFRRIRFVGPHWEITATDGVRVYLGENPDCRVFNPARPGETAEWLVSRIVDPNGNETVYEYEKDVAVAYPGGFAAAQSYLRAIRYTKTDDGSFLNAIRFDYRARPDAWTDYRYGFPVRTAWICDQILSMTTDLSAPAARTVDFSGRPVPFAGSDDRRGDVACRFGVYVTRDSAARQLVVQFPVEASGAVLHLSGAVGDRLLVEEEAPGGLRSREIALATALDPVTLGSAVRRAVLTARSGALALVSVELPAGRQPRCHARQQLTYRRCIGELDPGEIQRDDIAPPAMLLAAVQRFGYDAAGTERSQPATSFEYSAFSVEGLFPLAVAGSPNEPLSSVGSPGTELEFAL